MLHISSVHVGIVMAVARIWDGINDPIVGALIDRTPPKDGKKLHRYLGKLPILIGILTVFLFVDWGVGETWAIAFLLMAYVAYDMTFSFQDVALWGTLSLLSPHSGERTRCAQWLSITVPWIYFFKYCVSYTVGETVITGETVQFWYGILSGFPGAIGLFVAAKLANKLGGMKSTLVIAQVSSIVMRVISFFIGYDTIPKLVIVALLMAASSLPTGIMGIVNRSLLCDSIDYVEWKTGKRTEGMVSSLQNFVAKIGSTLQMLINGLVLGALGFDGSIEGIAGQPEAFYKWQWPLFILGPAVGALLYLIPVMMIHYSKEEKAKVEKELEQRRAVMKDQDGAQAAVKSSDVT